MAGDLRAEEHTLRTALGRRMRAARQERGLSTVQVARTVGVSPSLISQVERGLTAPSLDVLEGIARCLEVSIGSLADGDAPVLPLPAAAPAHPAVHPTGTGGAHVASSVVTAIPAGWDGLPLAPGPEGGQRGASARWCAPARGRCSASPARSPTSCSRRT